MYNTYIVSFLHPETTINLLHILPGMRIADFGCGSGHWAVLLAKATGPSGQIFAFDVQETALEATRSAARHANITSIETIRANLERPRATSLEDATLDAVMISNMLFQADEKAAVIMEAARVLKPRGRVFFIEWDTAKGGAPISGRVSRQAAEELFIHAGFRSEKEFNAGSHHFGIIFRKQQ